MPVEEPHPQGIASGGSRLEAVRPEVFAAGSPPPTIKAISDDRLLGRFYTPDRIAKTLVRWGLSGQRRRVLDPSFGGCSFLKAALSILEDLGVHDPGRRVFGADIDPAAREFADSLWASGVPKANLVIDDFFSLTPGTNGIPLVDAVVGNPPYIRSQWLSADSKRRATQVLAEREIRLSGRSNAWAYFVAHAMSFLRVKGRLVFLLPASVGFADYAAEVLELVRRHFRRSAVLHIPQRLFPDTEERIVVLLAEDYGQGPGELRRGEVANLAALERFGSDHSWMRLSNGSAWGQLEPSRLTTEEVADWTESTSHSKVRQLGTLASVRIGLVTGANRFFIRSRAQSKVLETAGTTSLPIVSRSGRLKTLEWKDSDQAKLDASGCPSRLIVVRPDTALRGETKNWIDDGKGDELDQRYKCRLRDPWYSIDPGRCPDAFLRYMTSRTPTIVLNHADSRTTNSIHNLWWRSGYSDPKAYAVASCTSLFALGCEIFGHAYGGGVLKLEPKAVAELPVPVCEIDHPVFAEVNAALSHDALERARSIADEAILISGLGFSVTRVARLRAASNRLAEHRRLWEDLR